MRRRFRLLLVAGPVIAAASAVPGAAASPTALQPAAPAVRVATATPVPVSAAGRAVNTRHPNHVVGHGTKRSCTSAAFLAAVNKGGIITFRCGPKHVTITLKHTALIRNTLHRVVVDGGGKVTLSGAGKRQIFHLDTCDHPIQSSDGCYNVEQPQLVVQNLTLRGGNSQVKQSPDGQFGGGGGGAIYDLGGRLKVVNTDFVDNHCYAHGPDLGGAAIRALSQYNHDPVYITRDTFRGGRCSNGSALSSIGTSWVVLNSTFTDNKAIGFGQNPTLPGTLGGGSGGAIYTDGNTYSVVVAGTTMTDNVAREGGGAIFYVSDDNSGTLTIQNSLLHHNPSKQFETAGYPGIFFHSHGSPTVENSRLD